MSNQINSDLLRGNINTIILKVLYEGDRYGYEIIKAVEDKTMGEFKLKQPTLYSCLNRLESQGFISSYYNDDEENKTGAKRRYYKMTENGKRYFLSLREDWEYSRTMFDLLISEQEYIAKPVRSADNINDSKLDEIKKSEAQIIENETKQEFPQEYTLKSNLTELKSDENSSGNLETDKQVNDNPLIEEKKEIETANLSSSSIAENKTVNEDSNIKTDDTDDEIKEVAAAVFEAPLRDKDDSNVFINLPDFMKTEFTREDQDKAKIEQYFSEYDIKVKFNEKEVYKKDKKEFIFINKLNLLSSLIIYVLFGLELLIFGLIQNSFANINPMHKYIYIAYALLGAVYFLYRLMQYITSPYANNRMDLSIHNAVYSKLIPYICYIAAILVFGFCFRKFLNENNLLLAVILFPPLYLFDLILEPVIKLFLSKKYYVEQQNR